MSTVTIPMTPTEDSDDRPSAFENKPIPSCKKLDSTCVDVKRRRWSKRAFQRRFSEVEVRLRQTSLSASQGHNEVTDLPKSPTASRRRSCSIAVARPTPDLHRFLQAEAGPWGHLSPSPRSPVRTPAVSPGAISSSSRLSAGASSSGHSPTSPSGRVGATLGARPKHRSRTGSMPAVPRHRPITHMKRGSVADREEIDTEEGVEYYRLRSFSITANGVFNVGDLFKARRSSANSSICSNDMRRLSLASQGLVCDADEAGSEQVATHKVGMLGAQGVGKTSLVRQFATSECRCAYDYSPDEECAQKTICVMLDGQETQLEIIDHRAGDMSVETFCSTYNPDIYVVVYSVVNKRSFKEAEETLLYLTNRNYMTTHGVILVGNKVDLERQRQVPSEVGRRLANTCECKFIETSLNLDHHVDELLVGILAQIKLNSQRSRDQDGKRYKHGSQILRRLLSFKGKTKSCENLFIL